MRERSPNARTARVRSLALAGVLACSACSLFTDLGGLTGGAAGGDGGADGDGSDGGPLTTGDASGPSDGPSVEGPLVVDGATGFCATQAVTLCDSFDEPLLASTWRLGLRNGTLTLATDAGARSSPNALVARSTKGTDYGAAALLREMGKAKNDVTIATSMRIDETASDDFWNGMTLRFHGEFEWYAQLGIRLTANGTPEIGIEEFRKISGASSLAWGGTLPYGTWTRIAMRVLRAPDGGGTITLSRDGVQVAQLPITAAAFPPDPEVEAQFGIIYSTTTTVGITTDDAVFDMK